jgi:hypothetical protein
VFRVAVGVLDCRDRCLMDRSWKGSWTRWCLDKVVGWELTGFWRRHPKEAR